MDAPTFEMTAESLARAMAARLVRERRRLADSLDGLSAEVLEQGYGPWIYDRLAGLAAELRPPKPVTVVNDTTPEPMEPAALDTAEVDGLPAVHHLDDFAEGSAMIQHGLLNSMSRRTIVRGAGGLRD